jgi:hypothetical protein
MQTRYDKVGLFPAANLKIRFDQCTGIKPKKWSEKELTRNLMEIVPAQVRVQVRSELKIEETDNKSEVEKVKPSIRFTVPTSKQIDQKNDRCINDKVDEYQLMDIDALNSQ